MCMCAAPQGLHTGLHGNNTLMVTLCLSLGSPRDSQDFPDVLLGRDAQLLGILGVLCSGAMDHLSGLSEPFPVIVETVRPLVQLSEAVQHTCMQHTCEEVPSPSMKSGMQDAM